MTGEATPGPWFVVPYGDGDSLVICSDAGGEWRICFMATHGGTASVWDAIQANAQLISTAPDLLAVVEGMLPRNLCLTNKNVRDDTVVPLETTMGELRKIAAVVAKARAIK